MNTKCLLKAKINFLSITKTDYIAISIYGKEVKIDHINSRQASDFIKDNNLLKASPIDYLDYYDESNGSIYVDDYFQSTVNSDPTLKRFIINALNTE